MARNHIGVLQKDTSDRVDNEIDQHVKLPLRDIDANRQWSQQNADTHSIAGRTISAHRAISRSTRPLVGAWKRPGRAELISAVVGSSPAVRSRPSRRPCRESP